MVFVGDRWSELEVVCGPPVVGSLSYLAEHTVGS